MNQESAKLSSIILALQRRRGSAITIFTAVIFGAVMYLIFAPRLYEAKTRLRLDEKQASVSELGRDLTQLPNSRPGEYSPLADQAELIKARKVLSTAIATVYASDASDSSTKPKVEELREELDIKLIPATNILEISYEHSDPEIAAKLLNAIADAMVDTSTETIRSEAKSLREFLETEVIKAKAEVAQAELVENEYRQAHGLVSLDNQTTNLVNNIDQLANQEQLLQAQIKEKKTQLQQLQKTVNVDSAEDAYISGRIGQDRELEELRAKLEKLEADLASARSYLTGRNPVLISLQEERDEVLGLYQQKLNRVLANGETISPSNVAGDELSQGLVAQLVSTKTELSALENKLAALTAERQKLEQRLSILPDKVQPLKELVRQREETNESLKFLRRKLEEARIAEAQLFSEIQIIESAEIPDSPSSPQIPVVLVVATAAGCVLALGAVVLIESFDDTLQDASLVEQQLELPILGVSPYLPPSAVSLKYADQFLYDPSLVEPYRLFLRNIEARIQEQAKLLVISSTIAGEGKSVVASHLAAVSAMLSRRTLIIDADLRRPKQHYIFGTDAKPGVAEVINGQISWQEAVKPTKTDNLSILTCGQLPTLPSLVLESQAMQDLLQNAMQHYDLVIVDTPPISSCADAHTLSQNSNGLVIVARPQVTPRDVLQRAVHELKQNRVPVIGFVVNGMTSQTDRYYRYAYDGYVASSPDYLISNNQRKEEGAEY